MPIVMQTESLGMWEKYEACGCGSSSRLTSPT